MKKIYLIIVLVFILGFGVKVYMDATRLSNENKAIEAQQTYVDTTVSNDLDWINDIDFDGNGSRRQTYEVTIDGQKHTVKILK